MINIRLCISPYIWKISCSFKIVSKLAYKLHFIDKGQDGVLVDKLHSTCG